MVFLLKTKNPINQMQCPQEIQDLCTPEALIQRYTDWYSDLCHLYSDFQDDDLSDDTTRANFKSRLSPLTQTIGVLLSDTEPPHVSNVHGRDILYEHFCVRFRENATFATLEDIDDQIAALLVVHKKAGTFPSEETPDIPSFQRKQEIELTEAARVTLRSSIVWFSRNWGMIQRMVQNSVLDADEFESQHGEGMIM